MKIILLYGPPSSGKGTHGRFLSQLYGIPFVEPAHIFRDILANPDHSYYQKLSTIEQGNPAPTDLYLETLEHEIKPLLESNTSFVIDKPGGNLPAETVWFLEYIKNFNPDLYVFVLDIPRKVSIKRASTRYFLPSGESYVTHEEAIEHAPKGVEPFRRIDDSTSEKVTKRYNEMYGKYKDTIIELFRNAGAQITIIDGTQDVLTVQQMMHSILA